MGVEQFGGLDPLGGCPGEEVRPVVCFGCFDGLEASQPGVYCDS